MFRLFVFPRWKLGLVSEKCTKLSGTECVRTCVYPGGGVLVIRRLVDKPVVGDSWVDPDALIKLVVINSQLAFAGIIQHSLSRIDSESSSLNW